jgi:hypothetical protein
VPPTTYPSPTHDNGRRPGFARYRKYGFHCAEGVAAKVGVGQIGSAPHLSQGCSEVRTVGMHEGAALAHHILHAPPQTEEVRGRTHGTRRGVRAKQQTTLQPDRRRA